MSNRNDPQNYMEEPCSSCGCEIYYGERGASDGLCPECDREAEADARDEDDNNEFDDD